MSTEFFFAAVVAVNVVTTLTIIMLYASSQARVDELLKLEHKAWLHVKEAEKEVLRCRREIHKLSTRLHKKRTANRKLVSKLRESEK